MDGIVASSFARVPIVVFDHVDNFNNKFFLFVLLR